MTPTRPHDPNRARDCLLGLTGAGLVIILALIGQALFPPKATAHNPGRAECRTYAAMHLLVTGSQSKAQRAGRACRIAAAAHVLTHPLPNAELPAELRRIRECESGGSYTAENDETTASGAYQYLDSTWGGHLGYARALYAPPRVQDRRALRDYNATRHLRGRLGDPWFASAHCWS